MVSSSDIAVFLTRLGTHLLHHKRVRADHCLGTDNFLKFLIGNETQIPIGFAQREITFMGVVREFRTLVVTNARVESGNEHLMSDSDSIRLAFD